jgi:hypothetical protein
MSEDLFDDITEYGVWLEDSGICSRYAYPTDSDITEWVCHRCYTVLECDPSEHECEPLNFFYGEPMV